MHDLAGLRQARAAKLTELEALDISPNAGSDILDRAEALQKEIEASDRAITIAEQAQRTRAATAKSAPAIEENANVPTTPAQPAAGEPEAGIYFAQAARSMIVGGGNIERAHRFAASTFGERHPVAMEIGAALQSNDAGSGGFLIPERFTASLIDLLMPRTVIRRACAANGNVVPLVGGTDTFPTVESGVTAYYTGEGQDITASEPTFGNVKMTEREIVALVPISNKLLRHASVSVDQMVRNLIVRGMAQAEDLAFLRGTGAGPGPRGIRYHIASANILTMTATPTLTTIDTDARRCELALMENDCPMIDCRWVMPPRVFTYLRDLRDSNGNNVWPSLNLPAPTWKGYPVEVTNNVPKNLGGGTEAEVYFVDFAFCTIADSFNIRIDASDVAAYKSGSDLVSAFSRNQTVIKATGGHDFTMTRTKAAAVLTGVTWGA